jgi:hypothetical protein
MGPRGFSLIETRLDFSDLLLRYPSSVEPHLRHLSRSPCILAQGNQASQGLPVKSWLLNSELVSTRL